MIAVARPYTHTDTQAHTKGRQRMTKVFFKFPGHLNSWRTPRTATTLFYCIDVLAYAYIYADAMLLLFIYNLI